MIQRRLESRRCFVPTYSLHCFKIHPPDDALELRKHIVARVVCVIETILYFSLGAVHCSAVVVRLVKELIGAEVWRSDEGDIIKNAVAAPEAVLRGRESKYVGYIGRDQ